jgi:[ribosomal protein S5]-alanine N-acetyltransferase
MKLETPRLFIKSFTLDDLEDFVQLHADPEVNRYLLPTGIWPKDYSEKRLKDFIALEQTHGYSRFKVSLKDGTFIGRAGFSIWEETGEAELGYSFKREYWGKGYATEVSHTLVQWIFETTDLEHLIGLAQVEHTASRKVLENIGMTFTDIRLFETFPYAFYKLARATA